MKIPKQDSDPDPRDRDLIEQMEALDEVIQWLESKDHCDLEEAEKICKVEKDEISTWLDDPRLIRFRR